MPEVHVELMPAAQVKVPVDETPLTQLLVAIIADMLVAEQVIEDTLLEPLNMEL